MGFYPMTVCAFNCVAIFNIADDAGDFNVFNLPAFISSIIA